MVADLIKNSILDKIENDIMDIEHDLKFVNVGGNKWQAQVTFDLDSSELTEGQKLIISQLLKYL